MMSWIRRRRLLLAYLILAAGTSTGLYFSDQGRQALCAQRHDLDIRIQTSEELLEKYPSQEAFRAAVGVPRPLIVQSVRQSKETRENLDGLYCWRGGG